MNITRFLGLAALSFGLLATQGHAAPPLEKTEIRYQGWVGQVTWIELAEDLGYLAPLKAKWVGNTISGPQDIQTVVTGDVDLGGAFNGAVVKLLAKKAPIKAVLGYYGVDENTWSGYYVKEDSPIKSARDLIGKKIAVNTLGAHHEFMVREYLERAKLTDAEAKQVTLVVTPPVTGEQALRQGHVEVTTLGGVLRDKARERGGIRPLFTDRDLYGNFTAGSIVLHNKFIEQNPNTSRHLVAALARSIEWARNTPAAEVRARFVKIIEGPQARRNRRHHPVLEKHRRGGNRRRDQGQGTPDLDRLAGQGRAAQGRPGQAHGPVHQCLQPLLHQRRKLASAK
jgi:ABC-type nitrate/sulfonate/bicarbonate transport system substrate-binding protein